MINTVLQAFLNERLGFTNCLELLAVLLGRKAIIRLTGTPDRLHDLSDLMRSVNLPYAIAPLHLEPVFNNPINDHFFRLSKGEAQGEQIGIMFAGNEELTKQAIEMEQQGCAAVKAAQLYAYPECCAKNYERIEREQTPWIEAFLNGKSGILRLPWIVNRIGRHFSPYLSMQPDYFPCSPHTASIELAKNYVTMLNEYALAPLVDLARAHLARPVLRYAGAIYWLAALLHDSKEHFSEFEILSKIKYAEKGREIMSDRITLYVDNNGAHLDGYPDYKDTVLLIFE